MNENELEALSRRETQANIRKRSEEVGGGIEHSV